MGRKHLVRTAVAVALAACALGAPGVRAQQREHCGTITNNETWTSAGNPHLIKCTVIVRNSVLTLGPSTTVLMAEGTSLIIQAGASLQSVGDPMVGNVRFQPNTGEAVAGYWGQIVFEAGATPSKLDLTNVRGGGQGGVAMIEVQDALVVVNRAQVLKSAGPALSYWANALGPSLEEAGQATTNYECTTNPHPNLVLERDATIAVVAGEHRVTEAQTWHFFCAPYVVAGDLVVAGADEPVLALDRGTTLKFTGDTGLIVGDGPTKPGQLTTTGSPEQPVVLTGTTAQPGSWRGLNLTADSGFSTLITARIEYGGFGGQPMVLASSLDASALDVVFKGALGYPLAVASDAVGSFLSGVATGGSQAFVANGVQRVLVRTNPDGEDLTGSATAWEDPGVPFELDGTLTIGNGGRPAKLTLAAGARLLFDGQEALEVTKGAALVAKGSRPITGAAQPVVLGSLVEQPGSWRGLVVQDEADLVQLSLTEVRHGGQDGQPMVSWGNADGTVTQTLFRGATGYPIALPLSKAPDVIMGIDQLSDGDDLRNRFEDNGTDRVLVHVDGPVTASRLKDWADPGAPVEFDGSLVAASVSGPFLIWHDGLDLRFRPGQGVQLAGPGMKGNIEAANDDPELPVHVGALDPAAGWAGFKVGSGGFLRGADLSLSGALTGAANLHADGGTVSLSGLSIVGTGPGIGLDAADGAKVTLDHGTFKGLEIGLRTKSGAKLDMVQSIVEGNSAWGILNEDPTVCQRALRVYWGKPTGPQDDSDAKDGCMNAKNTSSGADKVSNDVEWWPYAIDPVDFTPSAGIGPNAKRIFLPRAQRP